jgi:hypothetical protein
LDAQPIRASALAEQQGAYDLEDESRSRCEMSGMRMGTHAHTIGIMDARSPALALDRNAVETDF